MIRIILGIVLTVGAVVLRLLAPTNPALVERFFSRGVYPLWSALATKLNSIVSFSVYEYGLWAILLGLLIWIIAAVLHAVRPSLNLEAFWKSSMSTFVLVIGIVAMWYMVGGGLNYFRSSFTAYCGLEVRQSSVEELTGLCTDLAAEANRLSEAVTRGQDGGMVMAQGFEGSCLKVRQGYHNLDDKYNGTLRAAAYIRPKAVDLSEVMSLCRITGLYSFYTGEANINVDTPEYSIPYTIAHESAHVCGFMREDEANYIAYVACRASQDDETRYSGTMLALIHTLNALARTDAEAWREIRVSLSPGVQADLALNSAYWNKFDTNVGKVAEKANDAHLKLNDQQGGIQSYGRMVDLLLADWRDGGIA
ncbi:MAG: DUF3810 domain-containing protein [Oscillospiraceae bacterium]|nr:DUF3810 domain-containing protein [Oscillospiraceae bacterium]